MIFITGVAGFIGSHLAKRLLDEGYKVIGIDNLNDYYDPKLKEDRLNWIKHPNFEFHKLDLLEYDRIKTLLINRKPSICINLAAQAGVRYSLQNPEAYIDSNIRGFHNILELCKDLGINNLLYASSSSVYGLNSKTPFEETDKTDKPASLYAATKKTNELFAHVYSHLYSINTYGLRFFTVYGPWGRPDMAYYSFVNKIKKNEKIQIYNSGNMLRDFTYIDDIIESMYGLIKEIRKCPDEIKICEVFNIGNNNPIKLMDFIKSIEDSLSISADKEYLSMQKGDVKQTYSDNTKLKEYIGFSPRTNLKDGVMEFVKWFNEYHTN